MGIPSDRATHWLTSTYNFLGSYRPEKYQYIIQDTLQGMTGTRNTSDNIIIFGKDQE